MLDGQHFEPGDGFAWRIEFADHGAFEAELGGLAQAFLAAAYRAHFAGQTYFAEAEHVCRQRPVASGG